MRGTIKHTPVTCACVIEYPKTEAGGPDFGRPSRAIITCPSHRGIADLGELRRQTRRENLALNLARCTMAWFGTRLRSFGFDANRNLVLLVAGCSPVVAAHLLDIDGVRSVIEA